MILHEISWECSRLQLVDDELRAEDFFLSRSIQYLRDYQSPIGTQPS